MSIEAKIKLNKMLTDIIGDHVDFAIEFFVNHDEEKLLLKNSKKANIIYKSLVELLDDELEKEIVKKYKTETTEIIFEMMVSLNNWVVECLPYLKIENDEIKEKTENDY